MVETDLYFGVRARAMSIGRLDGAWDTEKKLVYIIIIAPFSHQSSSYIKCIKLNMYLSCNIKSVSDTEYS